MRSQQPVLAATIEGTLSFGAATDQDFGFGSDGYENDHYAIFTTANTTNKLYARLNNHHFTEQLIDLGTRPTGAHNYRIAWTRVITGDQVQFFIDDALVATLAETPLPPLYIYLSNNTDDAPLLVDSVRSRPPFVASGTFLSCPFDAGSTVPWQLLSWTADMPRGTAVGAETRTSLDGSNWSAWAGVASSGGALSNPAGRYLQYRLTLASGDPQLSPLVTAVTATYDSAASAPADGDTLTHTTADDFAACGGLSDTATSGVDDGALGLLGGVQDSFEQDTLDGDLWQWGTWESGSYVPLPSDGLVGVYAEGGAWIRSEQIFSRTLVEADLTFAAIPYQDFGFATDGFVGDTFVLFSTDTSTTELYAQVSRNGTMQRVELGPLPEGSHRYRIGWRNAGSNDQIDYYVDGLLVTSVLVAPLPPMYVYVSNLTEETPLLVDAVQTPAPFASSGTLLSCPFDAGAEVDWQALSWAADTPAGTTLAMQARTSADASSWSSWSAVTAGTALSVADGRYLQYQLTLTTANPQRSPLVFAVAAQHEPVEVESPTPADLLPTADPDLPSLTLHLDVAPDPVAVGASAAFTLTLSNQADTGAEDVLVGLPTPDGALALSGPIISSPFVGWQWDVGELAAKSTRELTGSLELQSMPSGTALLFEAQAIADGLDTPISETGGALVFDPAFGPASAVYTPTGTLVLTSTDGAITLEAPPAAASVPLTLTISTTPPPGADESPPVAGFQLGFGTFYLDATDPAGDAVHEFSQPLTVTMRYTPEQLRARGLAEHDLTLFWFDPTMPVTDTSGVVTVGAWQPIAVALDPATQTATARIAHFSNFQLSDGSSPSAAFIPSLQGFQVSSFTGAASYSYPIDTPAGPAGLKPSLALSYSSAATDGVGGQRVKQQAGWVGMGWTLDTGSVAVNKLPNGERSYTMVVDGQSYDLVRGAALVGSPSLSDPTHWDWRPTDESFIRVRVIGNGVSSSTRGGFHGGIAYPRYTWQLWTKSGIRYDFSDDMWWGWDACDGYATLERRWWRTRPDALKCRTGGIKRFTF